VWERDSFELTEGRIAGADASVTGDSTAWARVVFLGLPIEQAERDGALVVEDGRDVLTRVLAVFAAPSADGS